MRFFRGMGLDSSANERGDVYAKAAPATTPCKTRRREISDELGMFDLSWNIPGMDESMPGFHLSVSGKL